MNGERHRLTLYAKMNQNAKKGNLHKEASFHEFLVDIIMGRMLRGIENELYLGVGKLSIHTVPPNSPKRK